MESETSSTLPRQSSGIKAVPSFDDDYNDDFDANLVIGNDRSVDDFGNINELIKNNETSSIGSGNTNFSSGNGGSLVNGGGKDEQKNVLGDPDEESLIKKMGIALDEVSGTGSVMDSSDLPVTKVPKEGDDDRIDVEDGEMDGGPVEGSCSVNEVSPGVRVLGEKVEEEGGEKWDDVMEEPKVETPIGDGGEKEERLKMKNPKGDREEGTKVVTHQVGEGESEVGSHTGKVEGNADVLVSANEGDYVKESTSADIAVSVNRELIKESDVGVGNEEAPVVENGAEHSAAGANDPVKYTDDGDAVVDSINVDAAEAVRSGAAVVGEFEEMKDSGFELGNLVVENAAPVVSDSVADASAAEDSNLIETNEAMSANEEDSVVDSINVDVVELVRSGVAAVGAFQGEETEPEVKEAPPGHVAEKLELANDFVPPVATNSSKFDNAGVELQQKSQTVEAEAPQPVETVEQQDIEETKLEADLKSKQQEPTDELQSVSGNKNEKAQNPDDEPDAISVLADTHKKDSLYADALVGGFDAAASEKNHQHEMVEPADVLVPANGVVAEDEMLEAEKDGDDDVSGADEEGKIVYFGSGSSSNKVVEELKSHDRSEIIDDQVVTDSEDEGQSDDDGDGKELFDSAALTALLKAATSAGSDPGAITITSQDGSRLFSVDRPAGLGPSLRSVRPVSGPSNSSFIFPSNAASLLEEDLSEEERNKLQNLQKLKVKFLRLVQRVGFTAENSIVTQVLNKLSIFGGRSSFPAFSLDNAKQAAMQLESDGKDDLNFSLTVLVLGKAGVGKSAIINSIFLEEKVKINAFEPETTSVTETCGMVDGVKIRFIDVPGLKSSAMEQCYNRKVLKSVKKLTKKYPIDVMFYVDRLDSQTRDLNDLPMLRTITSSLGSSIWRNTIITLTHAASAPPDGPSGSPLSYEVFVAQRSHIVQQSIGQAVGDLRLMNLNMMSPVSLVENHPACRKNREGQKVLPNGQAWRPQLLVLCYSVKILSEATSVAKPLDPIDSRKLFGFRVRSPPLPYLLSSLLQQRSHPKLSADQGGDNVDSDIDLDDFSDSEQEEEVDEYDQLPPFKPLRKSQIAKLSGEQKKAYFEEYDYRVKLLQKKQWKAELKKMREMKKGKSSTGAYGEIPGDYDGENGDGENGAPATVPVPMPDMALPPSFDSDNPAYRYRFLEPTSQFLARPVLDNHGWDHDCGYDGVNVEQNLGIAGRFPASVTAQVTKDKKDFNVHLDSAVAAKHGENGSSLVGFDVQSIGKQYAYIIKGESKFKNLKKNKTTAGVSLTFLGENVASGVKVEDQIALGKRLVLVGSTGTVRSQKDAAYGANLEVRLREVDYPIGQEQSSFTLSLMKWRGDLAVGGNLQSQISVGRNSKMAVLVALNNKQSGQITVKTSSSDHLSLAIAGLLPIAISIYRKFKPGVSEDYSIY